MDIKKRSIGVFIKVYLVFWIYLALIALPKLVYPLKYVLGENMVDAIWELIRFSEHMTFSFYLPFTIAFSAFLFVFAFLLRKVGIVRVLSVLSVNLALPWILFEVGQSLKTGIIMLMIEVLILVLTYLTAMKASEFQNMAVAKKVSNVVAACAVVIIVVTAIIPADYFIVQKDEVFDLSEYENYDIGDMTFDEIGDALADFYAAYNISD